MWCHRSKRSRYTTMCGNCHETEIDFDDHESGYSNCGECERVMCEDCAKSECAICEENEQSDKESACCESCSAVCDEEDCDDIFFHRGCLAEHLQNCTGKSRAQRMLSAAVQTISTTESDLTEAKSQVKRIQSRIESLECTLAQAKEAKMLAELKSKAEAEK